ncbi:MAG: 5-formyltetrahydrofolate cyclo-ligase [Verrucomicrobiae bacterium]|nr:5-formyltetrahydrofolate cyclo-ligase [Verrucomicrobiae bacterium]MCP5524716.1 5-formyltetrahydrofolate cyclo-ligase [Verrucomicrobiales bacterium]
MTPLADDLRQQKRALRREMQARRRAMTDVERTEASAGLLEVIRGSEPWRQAGQILLFAPLPDEPDIFPLLEEALAAGRRLALPRFSPSQGVYEVAEVQVLERDLYPGAFGIREPRPECPLFPSKHLDFTLLPGVAFASDGFRLGRGKGYYDRLLPGLGGGFCGVAMDWQVLPSVPAGSHDKAVNWIATPTRWITVRRVLQE